MSQGAFSLSLLAVIFTVFSTSTLGVAGVWPEPLPQQFAGAKYSEAQAHLEKKRWAEAVIVLRAILKEKPNHTPALLDITRALVLLGRREEGIHLLSDVISAERKKPMKNFLIRRLETVSGLFLTDDTLQLYENGLGFLRSGRLREARERFLKALGAEPDNAEILLRYGQTLMLDGDFDSAVEQLKLAEKLNPYSTETRLWLGRSLLWRNEQDAGLERLKSAYAEDKGDDLTASWYAEAMLAAGQRVAAIDLLESHLKKHPLNLLSLITVAKLRLSVPPSNSKQAVWRARTDLQLALSRFDDYEKSFLKNAHDAGVVLVPQSPDKIKKEVESLLRDVETKIQTGAGSG